MANTTYKVLTPKSKTLSAATSTLLDTAVATQVNTLIQQYLDPGATGATVGDVENGSIVLGENRVSIDSNNATTWYATVLWNQWVIPT